MFLDKYNEKDIVSLIRLFPPSEIITFNNLSVSALKAIYCIEIGNPLFCYSNCSFD